MSVQLFDQLESVRIHEMLLAGLENHHSTEEHVPMGEFLVATSFGPSTLEDNEHNLCGHRRRTRVAT